MCTVVKSAAGVPQRIFLSWAHMNRKLKESLLTHLLPALGMFRDVHIEWWRTATSPVGRT